MPLRWSWCMLKAFPHRTSNLNLKSFHTLITAQFPNHVMIRGKVTVVKVLQEGCITHKSWSFAFNQAGWEWSKQPMPMFSCSNKRSKIPQKLPVINHCVKEKTTMMPNWPRKLLELHFRCNFRLSLCLHYFYKWLQEMENNVSKNSPMEIPNDLCYTSHHNLDF